jgi:hypothetical protein
LAAKLFILKNISISNGELQLNDRTGKLLEIITGRMLLNDNKTVFHHSFDDLIASYSNQIDNWKENKIKVNDSVFVALSWGFHYSEAIPVKHRVKFIAVLTAAINKAVTNATDFDISQLKKFWEDNVPESVELEKGEYTELSIRLFKKRRMVSRDVDQMKHPILNRIKSMKKGINKL